MRMCSMLTMNARMPMRLPLMPSMADSAQGSDGRQLAQHVLATYSNEQYTNINF